MIDLEEIRKETASEFNILIPKDDPALLMGRVFEKCLEQAVAELNRQHAANVKTLVNTFQQGIADGKRTSAKTITEGADYVKTQAVDGIREAMLEAKGELRKETDAANERVKALKRSWFLNGWVSGSGLILVLVLFLKWVTTL